MGVLALLLQCSIAGLVLGDILGRLLGAPVLSDGALGLAGVLMAWTGLLGAAIAARTGDHLRAGALEALLTPGARQAARRIGDAAAAVVCAALAVSGAQELHAGGLEVVEGVRTPAWAAPAIGVVGRLLPGPAVGPGTAWPSIVAWEEANPGATAWRLAHAGDPFPWWAALLPALLGLAGAAWGFAAAAARANPSSNLTSTSTRGDALVGAALLALPTALGAAWGLPGALFGVAASLTLLGAPLVAGVGLAAAAAWWSLTGSADGVLRDAFDATKKADLLSIPLFVFAGELMGRGGIAGQFVALARAAFGRVPGGLGIAAVFACAGFAALSGSSPVTLLAVGSVAVPMLRDAGWPERDAIGLVTAAGTLGILIPPSIPMVVYASVVSGLPEVGVVPTTALFAGGVLPGLLVATLLGARAAIAHPHRARTSDKQSLTRTVVGSAGAWLLPLLLLAGLSGRAFPVTVTEAAALAVAWALAVELGTGALRTADLPGVAARAAASQGALFLLLVLAMSANEAADWAGIPDRLADAALAQVTSRGEFLVMSMGVLLAAGCVLDVLSAILILAPILAPAAARFGIDPVHFGVLVVMNLEVGYLTPPMGINLFTASARFQRPLGEVIGAVLPYLGLLLLALGIVAVFPSLTLR